MARRLVTYQDSNFRLLDNVWAEAPYIFDSFESALYRSSSSLEIVTKLCLSLDEPKNLRTFKASLIFLYKFMKVKHLHQTLGFHS